MLRQQLRQGGPGQLRREVRPQQEAVVGLRGAGHLVRAVAVSLLQPGHNLRQLGRAVGVLVGGVDPDDECRHAIHGRHLLPATLHLVSQRLQAILLNPFALLGAAFATAPIRRAHRDFRDAHRHVALRHSDGAAMLRQQLRQGGPGQLRREVRPQQEAVVGLRGAGHLVRAVAVSLLQPGHNLRQLGRAVGVLVGGVDPDDECRHAIHGRHLLPAALHLLHASAQQAHLLVALHERHARAGTRGHQPLHRRPRHLRRQVRAGAAGQEGGDGADVLAARVCFGKPCHDGHHPLGGCAAVAGDAHKVLVLPGHRLRHPLPVALDAGHGVVDDWRADGDVRNADLLVALEVADLLRVLRAQRLDGLRAKAAGDEGAQLPRVDVAQGEEVPAALCRQPVRHGAHLLPSLAAAHNHHVLPGHRVDLLAATHHFDGPLVRNADLLVAGDVQQLLAQLLQQRDCLLCPQARGEESAQQRRGQKRELCLGHCGLRGLQRLRGCNGQDDRRVRPRQGVNRLPGAIQLGRGDGELPVARDVLHTVAESLQEVSHSCAVHCAAEAIRQCKRSRERKYPTDAPGRLLHRSDDIVDRGLFVLREQRHQIRLLARRCRHQLLAALDSRCPRGRHSGEQQQQHRREPCHTSASTLGTTPMPRRYHSHSDEAGRVEASDLRP